MVAFGWSKSARSRCSRCGAIAVFLAQHRVFCGYKRQGLGGTGLVAREFDGITDGAKSAFLGLFLLLPLLPLVTFCDAVVYYM